MLRVGTKRSLARVRSASATQTPACAAATISGRASERRKAVARLIGNWRSVGSSGAGLSVRPVARAEAFASGSPPGWIAGRIPEPGSRGDPGKAGGNASTRPASRGEFSGRGDDGPTFGDDALSDGD